MNPSILKLNDRFVVNPVARLDQERLMIHLEERVSSTGGIRGTKCAVDERSSAPVNPQAYVARLRRPLQNEFTSGTFSARWVPEGPDKVLDAPGILDDFYLNVLDWSVRNMLAVALGPSVYLWNGLDGGVKELVTLSGSSYISSLAWMHDGRAVSVGTSDGLVQIWDIEKNRKLRTMLASESSRVTSQSWSRHLLSTGSRDGTVLTHDVRVAKHLQTRHVGGSQEVCGLAWCPEGRQLAAGSNDNIVRIYEVQSSRDGSGSFASPAKVLGGHTSAVKALAWCPWKPALLATGGGSQDRSIRLWNTQLGECIEQIDSGSQVSALCWSSHSRELASSHGLVHNHLSIWKTNSSGRSLELAAEIIQAHDSRILHMCLSPDGRSVATAAADECIKFWGIFRNEGKKAGKTTLNSATASPFSLKTKSFR